jgi:hypothetical protein
MSQKFMASSILRHYTSNSDVSKHIFTDLLPIYVSHNTSLDTLEIQEAYPFSNLQTDSILSAPPPWKLCTDKLVKIPQTIGYNAFLPS